jgi:hypothetical protein
VLSLRPHSLNDKLRVIRAEVRPLDGEPELTHFVQQRLHRLIVIALRSLGIVGCGLRSAE